MQNTDQDLRYIEAEIDYALRLKSFAAVLPVGIEKFPRALATVENRLCLQGVSAKRYLLVPPHTETLGVGPASALSQENDPCNLRMWVCLK